MIRLMAEKVQKVSERVGFPSGNIQIDPVKSCGKNTDHQRKDKAEYLSSNDRIQGISRKKCCGNTTEEQMNWAVTYMLLTLLGFALNLLAAMPFTMSYYILSDNSDIKGVQALKASAKLMKGHYWEYMKMLLSFVPWIIFSIFTLYLELIWLVPYIETCMAVFYRNISGEFDEPPEDPYPPVTPIPQFHDETEA